MENIQLTEWSIIVIAICITIIFGMLIFKTKNGLKVKFDKSGVELDLAKKNKPETTEIENDETNTV